MKPSDFIHPEDAAALRQMESIPGFAVLVKKILAIGIENLQYGVNMASRPTSTPSSVRSVGRSWGEHKLNDMMDKTVNITGLWQDAGRVLAASSHTLPCCLSKPRSSLKAGKMQPKSSLEYACSVAEVLLYSSFGAPLVSL